MGSAECGGRMLRSVFAASRSVLQTTGHYINKPMQISLCVTQAIQNYSKASVVNNRMYCSLLGRPKFKLTQPNGNLLEVFPAGNTGNQTRSVTKFSLSKGKRKTVEVVLRKFYRLNWGIWIRGKCGREKRLYTKSARRKRRLRQHVFCNAKQSWLLDSMVTKYWRKPKYYVDDPYEPYHTREEYPKTRQKPYVPLD